MKTMISALIAIFVIPLLFCPGCGPDRLREVASVPGLDVWGLQVDGDRLYVAEDNRGLVILDISEPESPRELGELRPSTASAAAVAIVVEVRGPYAYLIMGNDLSVIDVSDPARPIELGYADTELYGVAVEGNYAYGLATYSFGAEFQVFDVATPEAPVLAGSLGIEARGSIAVSGDLAVTSDSRENINIIDVSDPTQPSLMGTYSHGRISAVAIQDNLAYAASGDGLVILDVSEPSQPRLLGCHATSCPNGNLNLTVRDGHAYLTGDDCLDVFDVSDPGSPQLTATLDTPVRIPYWAVDAGNGYIFLGHIGGMRIYPQEG